MIAVLSGELAPYDVQTMTQVFFPNQGFAVRDTVPPEDECICVAVNKDGLRAEFYRDFEMLAKAETVIETKGLDEAALRREVKFVIYKCLTQVTGTIPQWGLLTGVRPAKLLNEIWDGGNSEQEGCDFLKRQYLLSDKKLNLTRRVALAERKLLAKRNPRGVSLYIGIPFCPTRCLYCSFTSYPLAAYGKHMEAYVTALIHELEFLIPILAKYDLENIYIGGGTPSALNHQCMERLLAAIGNLFNVKSAGEYCIEAGRADSLDYEKLRIIKEHGATRLSVNPQTMNDRTLELIGRGHTVEQFINTYNQARELGFEDINTDLILGLPGETPEDVEYTFRELSKLEPSSITVHTLAIKRASRLREQLGDFKLTAADDIERMLDISAEHCTALGLNPYYMYRQKNMLGGFENVGWCRAGYENMYNIQIMEETQHIFAAGAGAVTKIIDPVTGRIERTFNVKSVEDYINRTDEMLERKRALFQEYEII